MMPTLAVCRTAASVRRHPTGMAGQSPMAADVLAHKEPGRGAQEVATNPQAQQGGKHGNVEGIPYLRWRASRKRRSSAFVVPLDEGRPPVA